MDSSGNSETLLVDQSGVDKQSTWSPDGTRICWASTTEATGGDYELFEMDVVSGAVRQLTNDSANQFTPDYRPTLG
jgi:Tol biopolymer transport system component